MKLSITCAALCMAVLSAGTAFSQVSGDEVRRGDVRTSGGGVQGTGSGATIDINNNQYTRGSNAQTQTIEGQIVDLHTVALQMASMRSSTGSGTGSGSGTTGGSSSTGAGAGSGSGSGTNSMNTGTSTDRTETGTSGLTQGGDKNRAGTASGNTGSNAGTASGNSGGIMDRSEGNTGTSVTVRGGNTNPSTPAAGTSGTNATGAGGTNTATSGTNATSGATNTMTLTNLDQNQIKKNLNAGVPAAIYSNGQLYTIVAEPKQLSGHVGHNMRVTGTVMSQQNLILPDKLEMRGDNNQYREVTFNKPAGATTNTPRTAGDR